MRKYLLLCTALTISSSAYAALDCATPPTCEEWGFTMTTSDCAGQFSLKCPFDSGLLFCEKEKITTIPCTIGSVLYDDLQCYNSTPSGKKAVAAVFDSTNRLAIGLNDASSRLPWSSKTRDISELTNYILQNDAVTSTETGYYNNTAIIRMGGNYSSSNYASGYCHNSRDGGFLVGRWWLPSAKEWAVGIYSNITAINAGLEKAGGTALTMSDYWTSTENSSTAAWVFAVDRVALNTYNKMGTYFVRCGMGY